MIAPPCALVRGTGAHGWNPAFLARAIDVPRPIDWMIATEVARDFGQAHPVLDGALDAIDDHAGKGETGVVVRANEVEGLEQLIESPARPGSSALSRARDAMRPSAH